ncbi:hypothetical protein EDB84DRAFT_1582895 [Lactarius hengduanensis]|nr:hypothetical protein EDB84DRAFT_1582895 [Lactarius hengduanensis]
MDTGKLGNHSWPDSNFMEASVLTLLEIVALGTTHCRIRHFPSACHTAEMTEGSIVDEGLHLVAAVQYCGFRSFVGTSVGDGGRRWTGLSETFYKVLFSTSEGEQGDTFPFRFRMFELDEARPSCSQRAALTRGLSDSNPTRSQPQRPPMRSFAAAPKGAQTPTVSVPDLAALARGSKPFDSDAHGGHL